MSSRWNEIADSIQAAIVSGKLEPGKRLPSETALAAEWSVCRMTVHRALTELNRQGLVTRKRRTGTVVRHREDTGTAPRVKTHNVALLFFHTNDFPQVEYIHGFRAGLRDEYHLLLCNTENDAEREAALLRRMQSEADALCCYPTCVPENTVLLRQIAESGTPVLFLDRFPDGLEVDAIITDNYEVSRKALQTLTRRGHRRIAFLTAASPNISSVRERREAFLGVMGEAGVTDAPTLIRSFPRGAGYDFEMFAQAVHDALFSLLHQPDPPTAVFCLEDYFLAAALEACDRMRIVVGRDLEILSFSDCPPMGLRLTREVHRIVQQANLMGRLAAEKIQARMSGDASPPTVERVSALFHPATSLSYNNPSQG